MYDNVIVLSHSSLPPRKREDRAKGVRILLILGITLTIYSNVYTPTQGYEDSYCFSQTKDKIKNRCG